MYENAITVRGNIVADPNHRRTDEGVDILSFRMASTPRRFDRATQQWVDGATAWFTVTTWRNLAANCAQSLRKGQRVVVQGRVSTRDWTTDEGRKGTTVEITADAVGHDLRWGTADYTRVVRTVELDLPGQEEADPADDRADDGRDPAAQDGRDDDATAAGVERATAAV